MKSRRYLAVILAGLTISGCSHFGVDSCTRLRTFKQFNWPSRSYYSLVAANVASLPSPVHDAVAAHMGRHAYFEIVAAKVSGPYLLLTVRQACFDCDRWFVYSTKRQCVVGTFVLGFQG